MLSTPLLQSAEYKRLLAGTDKKSVVALFGMPPSARAQVLSSLCGDKKMPALVITANEAEATRFCADLCAFNCKAAVFSSRDFVFHSVEGQNREYEYRRLEVLGNIIGGRVDVVCASVEAALQLTVPKEEFCGNTLTIKPQMQISIDSLVEKLYGAGYQRRFQVEGTGQFAVRGGIVDIFAPDMAQPARCEFWGDEIDTIHSFETDTQRRDAQIKKIYISPAREVLFGSCGNAAKILSNALNNAKANRKAALKACMEADLKALDSGIMPEAMDKYIKIRYQKPGTVFEYIENGILLLNEPSALREAAAALAFRANNELEGNFERGLLAPPMDGFYEDITFLMQKTGKMPTVVCENFTRTVPDLPLDDVVNAPSHSLPPWGGEVSALCEDLQPLINQGYSIALMAGTQRAAKSIAQDIQTNGIPAQAFTKQPVFKNGHVTVLEGQLCAGVDYPFAKFAVFTGRRNKGEDKKRLKPKNKGLSSLTDITAGDYVVHQNHGIGIYVGIQRMDLHGVVKDYIKISYDKGDLLYVPVTQLDIISRYTAPGDQERVKLTRLGGESWTKTKSRVRAATQDMAKELIALYAKRKQAKGFAFPDDNDWQRDFETRFEYDETDDQLQSAQEIKTDMMRLNPMDRLLCGDVGVGKTEVALRAAFKCVMGGKQCAILVPTTILAWQHFNTLLSRMEAFPVKIGLMSRFRTSKQQNETVKGLANGTVDIVVGTHRILQKDVKFNNLGLVIIDEEQRFGVKDKEKLKENFIGTDMLTLSATPIPRTLNMAMSGIRDMSTIEEPPFERKPIETYVTEFDENIVGDAIRRELARGGQVYYLYNRVETMDACVARVAKMAPDARIARAHGKMNEHELSAVWKQLLDNEIDILVCTTIIETGVDVRNCNTLIVEDSDRMGLSQLYQIRGRVGRSGRKAYAYFTFRRDKVLTDVAAKRLSAIREFTSFGSGFRIAMRDLQIRGAGSILGGSQHGHIEAVGYEMYVKLLNRAIAEEKGEAMPADKTDCLIDVSLDAYIPDGYIQDAAGRIEAYKKIAAIQTPEDASDVLDELIDRYGDVPKSVKGLADISLVRVLAAQHDIYEINQKKDCLIFYSDNLKMEKLRNLLLLMGNRVMVNASGKPYLSVKLLQTDTPLNVMNEVLQKME